MNQRKLVSGRELQDIPGIKVALVACCPLKADHPARPDRFYLSPLFQRSLAFAKRYCHRYELSLAALGKQQRQRWARLVIEQMKSAGLMDPSVVLIWLTGQSYCKPLLSILPTHRHIFPFADSGIWSRLSWLQREIEEPS